MTAMRTGPRDASVAESALRYIPLECALCAVLVNQKRKMVMTQNKDRPMEKSEWLRICANRLIEKAEITEKAATEIAEGLFDNAIFYDNPEADADEELSYWTE